MRNERKESSLVRDRNLGAAMVELALALPVFFLLIISVIEFSHLAYAKLNIDAALQSAGRYMITGQGQDLVGSPPDPLARLHQVQNRFCENLIVAGLSCTDIDSHFSVACVNPAVCLPPGPVSCSAGCNAAAGGPGQTVTLTVNFTKGWLTSYFSSWLSGIVSLSSKTTWKNEIY